MLYGFGPFQLDLDNAVLWQGGAPLTLRPKAFDLLAHLVCHAGQLVSKEELMEAVWPDAVISDNALTASMSEVRRALGETAKAPQYIATVHRRGYRFIAPVAMPSAEPESSDTGAAIPTQAANGSCLVDRDRDLAALHDQFSAMLRGDRKLVFVVGEAGIGKTTLVDAFMSQVASMADLWVGHGQCIDHYGANEAYLPLLDALGQLGRGSDAEQCLDVLLQQAPSWLLQMPALLSPSEFETLERRSQGATQTRMLRELTEAAEALAAYRPVVLVLEDLHWSDHATLDWLAFVARRRTPARLFVLGTYRPADARVRRHPITSIVHELQRQNKGMELRLDYLSETGVQAYLSERLSQSALPDALSRLLHQRTSGNPFFLVTMVEALIRQGIIGKTPHGWTFHQALDAKSIEIPTSIRHLIEQQLETLSDEDYRLLELASVAGAQFSAAALAVDCETTAEKVDARLGNLARNGYFIRPQGAVSWPNGATSGAYGFMHALYQEILYDRLPVSRRLSCHLQIGIQLEAGYGEQAPERAAELARHFEQGGDIERAVVYLQQAGAQAVSRSAQREAAQWYERALKRLDELPQTKETTSQAIDIHLALRTALIPLAENTKSFAHLRAAADLAASLGDDRRQGYIDAYLTREWFSMSNYDEALAAGHRALSYAQDDEAQRISTQLYLSYAYRGIGAFQRIVELLEPALATLPSAPDSEHLGLATLPAVSLRSSLTYALAELGRFTEGAAHAKDAIRIAEAHQHVFGLYQAYRSLGSLLVQQGRLEQALSLLEQCLILCRQADMPGSLSVTSARLGIAYVYAGRLTEGLPLLEQGVADNVTSHPDYVLRLLLLGEGYGYAGRRGEALVLAQEGLEMASARRERGTIAYAQHLLGQLYARSLETDANLAATCYRDALALACELDMRPLQAHCHYRLGLFYRQQREVGLAREALAQAVKLYQGMEMTFWLQKAFHGQATIVNSNGRAGKPRTQARCGAHPPGS